MKLNEKNVTAQMRLATLIHLEQGALSTVISAKQDYTTWLKALKSDSQNAQLFYCIGVYTFLNL